MPVVSLAAFMASNVTISPVWAWSFQGEELPCMTKLMTRQRGTHQRSSEVNVSGEWVFWHAGAIGAELAWKRPRNGRSEALDTCASRRRRTSKRLTDLPTTFRPSDRKNTDCAEDKTFLFFHFHHLLSAPLHTARATRE